jgi:hypothetical protein
MNSSYLKYAGDHFSKKHQKQTENCASYHEYHPYFSVANFKTCKEWMELG